MAQALWTANDFPAAGVAASATKAAPDDNATVLRCRNITVSCAGDGTNPTGKLTCLLADGAGNVLWKAVIAAPATGSASIQVNSDDLRAVPVGNASGVSQAQQTLVLTVSAPANSGQVSASMQGDIVEIGKPGYFG